LDLYNGGVQIAQIYPRNRGNLFRLVNHDCGNSFSAKVVCEIISGLLVPVFYAVRDIWDGEEITVKWSQDYRQGKECSCHSCHRHFDDRYGLK
jgi:SET domain-containing protein